MVFCEVFKLLLRLCIVAIVLKGCMEVIHHNNEAPKIFKEWMDFYRPHIETANNYTKVNINDHGIETDAMVDWAIENNNVFSLAFAYSQIFLCVFVTIGYKRPAKWLIYLMLFNLFLFHRVPNSYTNFISDKQFQESLITMGFVIVGLLVIMGNSSVYVRRMPGITPKNQAPVRKISELKDDEDVKNDTSQVLTNGG